MSTNTTSTGEFFSHKPNNKSDSYQVKREISLFVKMPFLVTNLNYINLFHQQYAEVRSDRCTLCILSTETLR